MPLWVKVAIGIGIVAVIGIIAVLAFGGAEHGPGRHLGTDDQATSSSPANPLSPSETSAATIETTPAPPSPQTGP